jgi:hypothetical protein
VYTNVRVDFSNILLRFEEYQTKLRTTTGDNHQLWYTSAYPVLRINLPVEPSDTEGQIIGLKSNY